MKTRIDTPKHQTADPPPAVFLTPAELAARWKVTTMSLRRWRKNGKLKTTYLGRGVRFAITEVERFETEARV
jgi:excisionase family DNA binding protein